MCQDMDDSLIQPRDFIVDNDLRAILATDSKNDVFTYAPLASASQYAEGNPQNDLVSALNDRTVSKKVNIALDVGPDECIALNSIKVQYTVKMAVGSTKISNWIMTEDGVRPAGTDVNWAVLKPVLNPKIYADKDGCLMPTCAFHARMQNIGVQLTDTSENLDPVLQSSTKDQAHTVWNYIVESVVNETGKTTRDARICNDMNVHKLDEFGNFLYSVDADLLPVSNTFITGRKFKQGTDSKTFTEKIWNRITNADDHGYLVKSVKRSAASIATLPPGCSIKLVLEMRGFEEGMACQKVQRRTSADAEAPLFVEETMYLQYVSADITYQKVKISEASKKHYLTTPVYGSTQHLTADMNGQFPQGPVWRRAVVDTVINYQAIPTGTTNVNLTINQNSSDIMPSGFLFAVSKTSDFDMSGLATNNWTCQRWAYNFLKDGRAKTTSGAYQNPNFMQKYQGGVLQFEESSEFELHNEIIGGSLYWDSPSASSRVSPQFFQQCLTAQATWLARGFTITTMPGLNSWFDCLDPASIVIKDAASGQTNSQLELDVKLKTAPPDATYVAMAMYYHLFNVVLDVNARNINDRKPSYSLNIRDSIVAMA